MASTVRVEYRLATRSDVPAMAGCRLADPAVGPADPRMAAYFAGQHHPQRALRRRTGFVATASGEVIGYIAGHLTTRHDCAGEVQYLYVAPGYRRRGVGSALLQLLAEWFQDQQVRRVCVCVDLESPSAKPFYQSTGAVPMGRHWFMWHDIGVVLRGNAPGLPSTTPQQADPNLAWASQGP